MNGLLLFLDFQKAFDSVNLNFIIETLKRFNSGPNFVKWVNTLYYNAKTCVKNNGYLSESINMRRGIKKGCPLSALLFILVVEIFARPGALSWLTVLLQLRSWGYICDSKKPGPGKRGRPLR